MSLDTATDVCASQSAAFRDDVADEASMAQTQAIREAFAIRANGGSRDESVAHLAASGMPASVARVLICHHDKVSHVLSPQPDLAITSSHTNDSRAATPKRS